jgi:hypothetical protein
MAGQVRFRTFVPRAPPSQAVEAEGDYPSVQGICQVPQRIRREQIMRVLVVELAE